MTRLKYEFFGPPGPKKDKPPSRKAQAKFKTEAKAAGKEAKSTIYLLYRNFKKAHQMTQW